MGFDHEVVRRIIMQQALNLIYLKYSFTKHSLNTLHSILSKKSRMSFTELIPVSVFPMLDGR